MPNPDDKYKNGKNTGAANNAFSRTKELDILNLSDSKLKDKSHDEIARALAVTDKDGKRIHSDLPLDGPDGLRTMTRERLMDEVHVAQIAGAAFHLSSRQMREFPKEVLVRGIERGNLSELGHTQLETMQVKDLVKIVSDKQEENSLDNYLNQDQKPGIGFSIKSG